MDDTFAAPVDQWTMLDPAYIRLKRLMVLIVWGIEAVILLVTIGLGYRWWAAGLFAVVAIGFIGYRWWRVPRMYRAWGYAERDIDLYIRQGVWERRMTVVPYGRMQLVTVNSGPVERTFGLATVTLETASSGTNATIPGLAVADADALRDRLSELGEQQAVGL